MKNLFKVFLFIAASTAFIFTSCKKDKTDSDLLKLADQKADIVVKGDGKLVKVITKDLVKRDDCDFIVAGTIEYRMGDKVVAIVDYGNGECDNLATKTVGDKIYTFKLDGKDKDGKYDKIIVEPLIKPEDCQYIVSGVIQFLKDGVVVATIDFGDGVCDEWATKTWNGGSKVFSMAKHK